MPGLLRLLVFVLILVLLPAAMPADEVWAGLASATVTLPVVGGVPTDCDEAWKVSSEVLRSISVDLVSMPESVALLG